MRSSKFDQIREANILAEQRYNESKNTTLPFNKLNESKETEKDALRVLVAGETVNPESVVTALAKGDKSENQKNLSVMAFIYVNWTMNIEMITTLINQYSSLQKINKKYETIIIKGKTLVIGNQVFSKYFDFEEYIHGESNGQSITTGVEVDQIEAEDTPIWSGNNIDIYDGIDTGKCIKYSNGALTGKGYSFCIGKPGLQNAYQGYRDNHGSSFYFIVDKNRFKTTDTGVNLDDPLHIVVFDARTSNIALTDANNRTGNIAEYGSDVQGYVNYLKSKGVPVEKLINKVKTPEEVEEQKLLGKQNTELRWFKMLTFDQRSKYIGRGHLLSDEQFDYLLS